MKSYENVKNKFNYVEYVFFKAHEPEILSYLSSYPSQYWIIKGSSIVALVIEISPNVEVSSIV